jgi:hypothetical protein
MGVTGMRKLASFYFLKRNPLSRLVGIDMNSGREWQTFWALYVRLLVSTNPVVEAKSNAGLVAGIVVGIMLLGYGRYYYFRRKAKPE